MNEMHGPNVLGRKVRYRSGETGWCDDGYPET